MAEIEVERGAGEAEGASWDPSLARASAATLPGMSQWLGIHWKWIEVLDAARPLTACQRSWREEDEKRDGGRQSDLRTD